MKKYFTLIALILFINAIAQKDTLAEKKKRIEASISMSASHRKMVQFTGTGMGKSLQFQDWMDRDFGATKKESSTKYTATSLIMAYTKNGGSPSPIKITYTFKKDETVAKVEIAGKWDDVVKLFLNYWERPLRIEEKQRGEIVWFNSFADRVALSSADGLTAKISITNNGLNTY